VREGWVSLEAFYPKSKARRSLGSWRQQREREKERRREKRERMVILVVTQRHTHCVSKIN